MKIFQHIGQGQAAGKEEGPLQHGEEHLSPLAQMDVLHNALVEQGLADIAAEQRQTRQAEHGHRHHQRQGGFAPAKAPDLIEIEGVGGQVDDARGGKEDHFNDGVVQDVEDGAVHRQGVVLPPAGTAWQCPPE